MIKVFINKNFYFFNFCLICLFYIITKSMFIELKFVYVFKNYFNFSEIYYLCLFDLILIYLYYFLISYESN